MQRTAALLQQALPDNYVALFRPPYGQRRDDSAEFFRAQGLKVSLWNIDSEDWSPNITADQAGQRVLTLMLLWRRGVVVFHDIHNKVETALLGCSPTRRKVDFSGRIVTATLKGPQSKGMQLIEGEFGVDLLHNSGQADFRL